MQVYQRVIGNSDNANSENSIILKENQIMQLSNNQSTKNEVFH